MRRDLDLLRLLLLKCEEEITPSKLDVYSKEAILSHSVLLIEAGLVHGEPVYDAALKGPTAAVIVNLTWAGHEFINLARHEKIWRKTKARLHEAQTSALPLVIELLKQQARKRLKLPRR